MVRNNHVVGIFIIFFSAIMTACVFLIYNSTLNENHIEIIEKRLLELEAASCLDTEDI